MSGANGHAVDFSGLAAAGEAASIAALGEAAVEGVDPVAEIGFALEADQARRLITAQIPGAQRRAVTAALEHIPPGAVPAILTWVTLAHGLGIAEGHRLGFEQARAEITEAAIRKIIAEEQQEPAAMAKPAAPT